MRNKNRKAKCFYIRSSEDEVISQYWKEPEYDADSGRWYDCFTNSSAYYKGCKNWDIFDDMMCFDTLLVSNAGVHIKDTTCKILYDTDSTGTATVNVVFREYQYSNPQGFAFTVEHASQKRIQEIIEEIRRWHSRGEICIGDFLCYPCSTTEAFK